MKYLTTGWYDMFRRSAITKWIIADPKAESFDEVHYQEMFQKKLRQHLKAYEPLDPAIDLAINQKEYQRLKAMPNGEELAEKFWNLYLSPKAQAEFYASPIFQPDEDFDPEKATEEFKRFQQSWEDVFHTLPDEILSKIKDIRLAALGYASQEVVDLLKPYCEEQDREQEQIEQEVSARNAEVLAETSLGKEIDRQNAEVEEYARQTLKNHLNDESFERLEWRGKDLYIRMTEIAFLIPDAVILEQEEPLIGALWAEHEMYRKGDRFEFHILGIAYEDGSETPIYFTVEGSDIQFADVD